MQCLDCGCAETHPDTNKIPCRYCRLCAEKNGHAYLFVTTIDHDKLRAKLGDELAESVLKECRAT